MNRSEARKYSAYYSEAESFLIVRTFYFHSGVRKVSGGEPRAIEQDLKAPVGRQRIKI